MEIPVEPHGIGIDADGFDDWAPLRPPERPRYRDAAVLDHHRMHAHQPSGDADDVVGDRVAFEVGNHPAPPSRRLHPAHERDDLTVVEMMRDKARDDRVEPAGWP